MRHLLPILLLLLLVSCKTRYITQTVEVPVIHTELRTDTLRDSIHVRDSVTIYTKGDTVYNEQVKVVEKWKEKVKVVNTTDTVTQVVEKPFPIEKPVIVEVEKKLTAWQKTKMDAGGALMVLLATTLLLCIVKLIRRWKK